MGIAGIILLIMSYVFCREIGKTSKNIRKEDDLKVRERNLQLLEKELERKRREVEMRRRLEQ